MAIAARREHPTDRATRWALGLVALAAAVTFVGILVALLLHSLEAFRVVGWRLLGPGVWDPVNGSYAAWPYVFGTLLTSLLALVIAVPIGFAVALFLTELSPLRVRTPLSVIVELLAGVPSIVYGMWGIAVVAPLLRTRFEPWAKLHLGWIPLFTGPARGYGFLLAGLVLAIMILPTITAISRDALLAVPRLEREAAYALGATRWEVARGVLRSAKAGLFAAATLGLGRALGETIAVTLVIGNVANTHLHLFEPGQTIASTLATQINEATDPLYVSVLVSLGLILFLITLVVNLAARLVIERPWRRRA